jgi:hypothetical protein
LRKSINSYGSEVILWGYILRVRTRGDNEKSCQFYKERSQKICLHNYVYIILIAVAYSAYNDFFKLLSFLQLFGFWTLSIVLFLFHLKHNVSETGFCLHLHVKAYRTTDNVQKLNNCINLISSQTFIDLIFVFVIDISYISFIVFNSDFQKKKTIGDIWLPPPNLLPPTTQLMDKN